MTTITWVEESGRITIARTFTSRSAAQAGLNALALVVESAFVPSVPRTLYAQHGDGVYASEDYANWRKVDYVPADAEFVNPPIIVPAPELHPVVEAIAYRDADESGPQMMGEQEALSR